MRKTAGVRSRNSLREVIEDVDVNRLAWLHYLGVSGCGGIELTVKKNARRWDVLHGTRRTKLPRHNLTEVVSLQP